MWATDRASPIGRTLGAEVAALLLAGSVLGAPATPPTVTDADIERARQQHRMPTEAGWRGAGSRRTAHREPPQPVTRMPIDLEAISKGFDLQNGVQAAAMTRQGRAEGADLRELRDAGADATVWSTGSAGGRDARAAGLVNGSIRDTVTRMQALIGSQRVAVRSIRKRSIAMGSRGPDVCLGHGQRRDRGSVHPAL